jgi:hypothetical protein
LAEIKRRRPLAGLLFEAKADVMLAARSIDRFVDLEQVRRDLARPCFCTVDGIRNDAALLFLPECDEIATVRKERSTLEAVQKEAARSLADMARDAVRKHHKNENAWAPHGNWVRDDHGPVLQVKFTFEVDGHATKAGFSYW